MRERGCAAAPPTPPKEWALGWDCFRSLLMHEGGKGQASHIIAEIPLDTVRGENPISFSPSETLHPATRM